MGFKNQHQNRFSIEDSEILGRSTLYDQKFTEFSQEYPVFGYKLVAEDTNPIDRDEEGLLILTQNKFNYVDIILKLECGEFSYENLPIYGELIIYSNNEREYCYYIEDPLRGFFMELTISKHLTYIDLAFDGGYCQLCYNGFLHEGYETFEPSFNEEIETIFLDKVKKVSTEIFGNLIKKEKEKQKSNIKIHRNEVFTTSAIIFRYIYTKYGIAHEVADEEPDLAEDLPDDYWEPYTEIDIGIYRREPSEATVKSDLQYYNKNYFPYYFRDIVAYAIYAHGNAAHNTAWSFGGSKWLYPSEVEDLWYIDGEISVYPSCMHIHATVCWGYSGSTGVPHMAKAFVDNNAEAFVGATLGIPIPYNDEFTADFWYDMCQGDDPIHDAAMSYVATHNYYFDPDWTLGTEIKIYGDINSRIDN
jgi:hypothetical protein